MSQHRLGMIGLAIGLTCTACAGAPQEPPSVSPAAPQASSAATTESTQPLPSAAVTHRSEASLTFVPSDFKALWKNPQLSLVARGTVTKVEYRHDPAGTAYTLITLDVDKTWRGAQTPNLTYLELGGFIRQGDLDAINGPKDGMPSADPSQLVDQSFLGAEHSRVGERQIVFLHQIEGQGYDYESLQGPFGQYRWRPDVQKWRTHPAESIKDPSVTDPEALSILGT